MNKNTRYLFIVALIYSWGVLAQNMRVVSFNPLPNDMEARLNPKKDLDDDPCILIKIVTIYKGFNIDVGGAILCAKDESKTSEVWLWVSPNVRKLRIQHDRLGVLDYRIPIRITKKNVYELRLEKDGANEVEKYFRKALRNSNLKRYERAIAYYDIAIELNPDYARAYNNRGVAKSKLDGYKEAIADYDKAIALEPDFAVAYRNRGAEKAQLNRNKEAIADCDKAIELDPDDAKAYFVRGAAKYRLDRNKEAIADYDKAIELKPDFAVAYFFRVVSKAELGRYKEAIADCDKGIELKPNDKLWKKIRLKKLQK